jgi:DNA-directed RNA polymerase specialized sigma24 family protein
VAVRQDGTDRAWKGAKALVETGPSTESNDERGTLASGEEGDDLQRYEELILSVERQTFRFAYLLLRDAERARKLLIRTLVSGYAQSGERGEVPFLPWLLRRILDDREVRAAATRLSAQGSTTLRAFPRMPPEVAAVRGAQHRALLAALSRLTFEEQVAVYLHYFLDLPTGDTALVLSCSNDEALALIENASSHMERIMGERP